MKPLEIIVKRTDELKKLILEHPDTPIVCLVDSDVCQYEGMWYAPDVRFKMGEILNCEQDVNDERVFFDRIEFEEKLAEKMEYDPEYEELSDEEFGKAVEKKAKEYEPYWTDVIQITATI